MSFNMPMFLNVLRGTGALSDRQINSVKEAYNIASSGQGEFREGDIFRSTQGTRLLAKLKDGKYVMIALVSSDVRNSGNQVGNLMTLEQVTNFVRDRKYEKTGNISTAKPTKKPIPVVFDYPDDAFSPPPIKNWRRGPLP